MWYSFHAASEAESCMHPLSNHQSNPTADWNSDSLLLPSDPTQTCDNDIENRVSENITESETGDIGTTNHDQESNLSDQGNFDSLSLMQKKRLIWLCTGAINNL